MSEPQPKPAREDFDKAVEKAIDLCGGDLRAAIRGLIEAQRIIEQQVSAGYVRGRFQ